MVLKKRCFDGYRQLVTVSDPTMVIFPTNEDSLLSIGNNKS
jgi:hypothetical protein